MTLEPAARTRRPAGLEALPCFSLMDSDVPMHTFLHLLLVLVVAIAVITWLDQRVGRRP